MKYFIIFLAYIASPKNCLHCTHFIPDKIGNGFGTCKFFPVKTTDTSFFVTEKEVKYNYCVTARKYDYMCGDYAKHYFPINPQLEIEPSKNNGGNGGGDWDDFSGLIESVFS
jgi:hypothetical protein